MKFIDPRTDFAFKKIFGSEQSKRILISFLNAVMGLVGDRKIADLTIIDPYQLPKIKELKLSILDVKCQDLRGTTFVVEMQVLNVEAIHKRIVYNVCKAYTSQLKAGEEYPRLNQVVGITITDFVLFEELNRYLSRHVIKEDLSNQVFLDEVLFYFIELPKFTKALEEIETVLEKWIYFLKNAGGLEVVPEKLKEAEEIEEAFEIANVSAMTVFELELYEKRRMALQDQIGAVQLAERKGREEGRKEGREEGIQIGKQEGKEEGRKEGREEGKKIGLVEAIRAILKFKFQLEDAEIFKEIARMKDLKTIEQIYTKAQEEEKLEKVLAFIRKQE